MAKIALSKVEIENVATGAKLSYLTTSTPKESTLGNSMFGTLNSQGIAELQAKGFAVYDEQDYCELIRKTFGLTENAVGDRGPNWATPEDRAKYKVFLTDSATGDRKEYCPEYSTKALKRAEEIAAQKKAKEEALAQAAKIVAQNVVAPAPQVAVADSTPVKSSIVNKADMIAKIKEYSKSYNKEEILKALSTRVNATDAELLYNEAMFVAPVVEKPVAVVPIF